jgi:single-strand DNA-binding protein
MTTRRNQTDPADVTEHRNEVRLVGDLTREARIRSLPDGTEVSSFVLRVRSETGTSETVECVARSAALRNRLAARHPGDTLEVSGSLRHRFWRGTGGTMSRYEVEVSSVALHRRGGAPVTGRRNGETPSPTPASA